MIERCSPGKTLEVLGSMKIFLSLDGIIYILGLSHEIVTKRARTETLQHLTRNLQVWGVLNLIGADLHRADLWGADLSGADLSGADSSGCRSESYLFQTIVDVVKAGKAKFEGNIKDLEKFGAIFDRLFVYKEEARP